MMSELFYPATHNKDHKHCGERDVHEISVFGGCPVLMKHEETIGQTVLGGRQSDCQHWNLIYKLFDSAK
jgi:hypothetical protein